MRKLLPFLLLLLAVLSPGLTPAAFAVQTDSSQGLTWTSVHSTTFTSLANTSVNTTPGSTTGAGGYWIDELGNNWNISAGALGSTSSRAGQNLGDAGALDQPASATALNQRIIVKAQMSAGLNLYSGLRIQNAAHQLYSIGCNNSSASNYYFNNYQGGGSPSVVGLSGAYTAAIPVGDYFLVDESAVSSAGGTATTLALTVTDLGTSIAATTGTIVFASTAGADTSAGVQSPGQIGVMGTQSLNLIVSLQTFNNGSPVPPALSAGAVTVSPVAVSTATLASAAATGGTAPYSYALYRSPTPLFTPGAGGTLVASQSGVAAGSVPAAITDTYTPGKYWYKWLVTDSVSVTASSSSASAIIADRSLRALVIGDSKIAGDTGNTLWQQRAALPNLVSGGSGYTTASISVANPSGFAGRSATFGVLLDGAGHVSGAYPIDPGTGYIAAVGGPTISVVGNGTGATFAPGQVAIPTQAGGGVVIAAEQMLSGWGGGYHLISLVNGGIDGAISATFSSGRFPLAEALAAAGPPSQCPVIMSDVGINDSGSVAVAAFKSSELARAQYLVGLGYLCVLNLPYGASGLSDTQNDALIGYRTALQQIAATDPVHIKIGVTQADAMGAAAPGVFYLAIGDLHPSVQGMAQQGANIAQALAPLLGLSVSVVAPLTLTVTAGVNSEVLTWTADSGATNGYEVDWKPSSVLPVAGQVKSIVAIVGPGVLTWTDTSAYRLAQSGRYNVVGLH